jgi:hypothetical protein
MPPDNPFKRDEPVEDVEIPGAMCPILGFAVVPIPKQTSARLLRPGEAPFEMTPMMQECQQDRCKFWNHDTKECRFTEGLDTLSKIADSLKMFGR